MLVTHKQIYLKKIKVQNLVLFFVQLFGQLKMLCIFDLSKTKEMTTSKVYNSFADKFGNNYSFTSYMDFASFWFNLSRKNAESFFPTNFTELQKAAANSKEARTKVTL